MDRVAYWIFLGDDGNYDLTTDGGAIYEGVLEYLKPANAMFCIVNIDDMLVQSLLKAIYEKGREVERWLHF